MCPVMTAVIPSRVMIVITVNIVTGIIVHSAAPIASHAIQPSVWGVLMNVPHARCRFAKLAQRSVKTVRRYSVSTV